VKVLSRYQEDIQLISRKYLKGQFMARSYFYYTKMIFQLIYNEKKDCPVCHDTNIQIKAANEDFINKKINS